MYIYFSYYISIYSYAYIFLQYIAIILQLFCCNNILLYWKKCNNKYISIAINKYIAIEIYCWQACFEVLLVYLIIWGDSGVWISDLNLLINLLRRIRSFLSRSSSINYNSRRDVSHCFILRHFLLYSYIIDNIVVFIP